MDPDNRRTKLSVSCLLHWLTTPLVIFSLGPQPDVCYLSADVCLNEEFTVPLRVFTYSHVSVVFCFLRGSGFNRQFQVVLFEIDV